ncbi:MAG TPA: hypothetical protein VGO49_02900 [Bradyrhizobium sp.]|jgi:hypothetical protein|nr:hypothetical protein [Bradyrhizobium sp.]
MAAFISVQYFDPFGPLPITTQQAGVQIVLDATGVAAGNIAYAQLLANQTPVAYGGGANAAAAWVVNTVPLAAGPAYVVQIQFSTPGQNPANLDWSNPANIISSPVVVHQLRITELVVTASGYSFSWEAPGGAPISGAYLQVIDGKTKSTTSYYYLGVEPSATVTADFKSDRDYLVMISAVQPVKGGIAGNFGKPYTIGPPTAQQPIPTRMLTPTRTTCGDGSVAVQWTAPAIPANAPTPRYELLLLGNGGVVAAGPGGAGGGQIATGGVAALASPQAAGRMSFGAFVGQVGTPAALYPLMPQITGVSVTGTSGATITAQLASPGPLPTGGVLVATLYTNGVAGPTQSLSAATGSVLWSSVTVDANSVYAIDVALVVTAGGVVSEGTHTPRLAVPLTAPTNNSAVYDGEIVTVNFAFAQPVDRCVVTLTASGATTLTVNAGGQLPISFPANLDISKTWTATVTPAVGIANTLSGSSPVTLPTVAAPALTSVVYDGTTLSLQWSAATLPFLSGYRVAMTPNGPSALLTSDQTACAIPLSATQANGASVTVSGISPLRSTAASAAVAILSNAVEVNSVTVGSNVVAAWTVSGTPPAMRAELMIGDNVSSVVTGATATGVTFAAPTPTSQPYRLRTRAVSADGVASGPASKPVDLILTAPAFKSGHLGDSEMSLRWDPVNPFGVTAYLITATPTSGTAASLSVTGTGYDGLVPAAFLAPGTLTIVPTNPRCIGPAATVALHAPGSFTTGTYSNGQLSITTNLGIAGGTDTFWLDVLVDGNLAARKVLVQSTTSPIQNPITLNVAIAQGASAVARIADVGPATLGPASPAAAIPTVTPSLIAVAYDGAKFHVTWQPTPGPNIDGYVVSIANTTIPDTYVAGAGSVTTSIATTLTYPFAANVAVSVRAACGGPSANPYIQGPASIGLPPMLAGSAYSSAVGAAGNPPYLYRRGQYQLLGDVSGKAIVLYLPKPFTVAGNPTVPPTGTPPFQLAAAPVGSALPYQLTISADVWASFGTAPVRAPLRDSYVQFLNDVEDVGVFSWAIGLIRQIIAGAMPQTFEEVPYYRYGMWRDDKIRVVDLTPGTRVQLANALSQTVVGGVSQKNGFLALGNEMLEIVDAIPQGGGGTLPAGAGRSLSVDAFLSLVYPGGGPAAKARPIAAGAIDFFDNLNRQAYYRLFYPVTFPGSGSTGSTALEDNITLVGTMSWKTLSTVTQKYADTTLFPTDIDYFATYFRGRSGVTPLINVAVQSEPRWVALGTSVRQLLAAQGLAPYFGGNGGNALEMRRASSNLFGYAAADPGLSLDPVNLGNQDLGGVTPMYWPLDMPLVGGDQVALRMI